MRTPTSLRTAALIALAGSLLLSRGALAGGPIGEHVNDLDAHLDAYTEEVRWLIDEANGIVERYGSSGVEASNPAALMENWEAVDFHAAIETNYIPLYASIWQGLFAVRSAIEAEEPLAAVQVQQAELEQTLWQSLGAVKMAAKVQATGVAQPVEEGAELSPVATLDVVKERLNRVVAKYAEQLSDEAIEIVQDTYLSLFEGVEGALIEQDAGLVEDLEIDFNVTLPKAIQDGGSVDAVRAVVVAMNGKVDTAKELLAEAEASRSSVF